MQQLQHHWVHCTLMVPGGGGRQQGYMHGHMAGSLCGGASDSHTPTHAIKDATLPVLGCVHHMMPASTLMSIQQHFPPPAAYIQQTHVCPPHGTWGGGNEGGGGGGGVHMHGHRLD